MKVNITVKKKREFDVKTLKFDVINAISEKKDI